MKTESDFRVNIGLQCTKISGKPFKSGRITNTINNDYENKKVKPVLVESESKSCKGDLVIDGTWKLGIHISKIEPSYYNKQQLILISLEDEEIGDSKERYFESSDETIKIITDKNVNIIGNYYNIVARQSQLSPELIQQLIDEYNNGGMKDFEIEWQTDWCKETIMYMEAYGDDPDKLLFEPKPKLTNGFVTVVKKPIYQQIIDDCGGEEAFSKLVGITKEPILYTEEEVENILTEYSKALQPILIKHLIELTPVRWFRENKKNKTTTD